MKKSLSYHSSLPTHRLGAVVLARMETGEADLIITFLTRERGLLTAIAKNARKSFRRFGGGLLNPGRAAWYDFKIKPKAELALVEKAENNPRAPALPLEPICQTLTAWALELVRAFEAPDNPAEASFNLLLRHLGRLASASYTPPALEARRLSLGFTKCYLELAGFSPDFSECQFCHQTITNSQQHWFWDHQTARLCCPDCAKPVPGAAKPVPPNLILALLSINHHANCPELPDHLLALAEDFYLRLSSKEADRSFKSPTVLRALLRPFHQPAPPSDVSSNHDQN